jgi:hypothetical protein
MLVIELVLPFFIYLPRRLRLVAAWGFVLLRACILLTRNYGFSTYWRWRCAYLYSMMRRLACLGSGDARDLRCKGPRSSRRCWHLPVSSP